MTGCPTRCVIPPGLLRVALVMLGLQFCGMPPVARAAPPQLTLPGLKANVAERFIDIEATVCLDKGLLELVACRKGTKEHESIVAVEAAPMHIHTALLVLGARNGQPAMRRPLTPAGTGWIDVPPSGDPIHVSLVFPDADGKLVEHGISEFVAASDMRSGGGDGGGEARFPDTFLFAGSQLHDNGDGPHTYLADESGNLISIATFGDELLCMDGLHGQGNDALMWQIKPEKLPPVGTKVTLRLRPHPR